MTEYSATCSLSESKSHYNWLNNFETGHVIGETNRETSGGFANYIVQRLVADSPGASIESMQKFKFNSYIFF